MRNSTHRETCPSIILNNLKIPQAKYLRLHLDRRLNWRKHIFTKKKQLRIQLSKIDILDARQQIAIVDRKELLLTRQSLNPFELMASNYGEQPPTQTYYRDFKTNSSE